jgi:hypothetical protein
MIHKQQRGQIVSVNVTQEMTKDSISFYLSKFTTEELVNMGFKRKAIKKMHKIISN